MGVSSAPKPINFGNTTRTPLWLPALWPCPAALACTPSCKPPAPGAPVRWPCLIRAVASFLVRAALDFTAAAVFEAPAVGAFTHPLLRADLFTLRLISDDGHAFVASARQDRRRVNCGRLASKAMQSKQGAELHRAARALLRKQLSKKMAVLQQRLRSSLWVGPHACVLRLRLAWLVVRVVMCRFLFVFRFCFVVLRGSRAARSAFARRAVFAAVLLAGFRKGCAMECYESVLL